MITPYSEPLPPDPRRYMRVPVSSLFVDPELQRHVRRERVEQIANEFEWPKFETPTCAHAGTKRYRVVEGQHRVLALQLRDPRAQVWIAVLPSKIDPHDEVDIALTITTGRRSHNTLEKWVARFNRGDDYEVLANRVLSEHKLRLGASASARTLACPGTIAALIHNRRQPAEEGAHQLDRLLTVIERAYPGHDSESATSRWDGRILRAVGELIYRNPDASVDRLVKTMRTRIAQAWISEALRISERSPWQHIAESVMTRYNRGLRSQDRRMTW
jgi:hypothetical protein